MSTNKKISVQCPTCSEKFHYYSSEFRPFCSEKCKMIDLGMWFDEAYKVPLETQPLDYPDEGMKHEH
jgi:endogenous inhibitor of DNA gyrase (YacG/DUF329 family)